MKYITLLFLLNTPSLGLANSGPEVVCVDCDFLTEKPLPRIGTWYNPEQSGTGMTIDIQVDKMFGVYYGYEQDGSQVWANFSGDLIPSEETGNLWEVTAEMVKFTNGSCINCEYTGRPTNRETVGIMQLVFNHMGHATFSIDGGTPQNIVPFYFGVPAESPFPEITDYIIPNTEGWWNVYVQNKTSTDDTYYSFRLYMTSPFYSASADQYLSFGFYPTPFETITGSLLYCEDVMYEGRLVPDCYFSSVLLGRDFLRFKIPIGNITAERIFGETEDGFFVEFNRLHYNKCFFSASPEECVNTNIRGE